VKKLKVQYEGKEVEVDVPDDTILPSEAGQFVTKEFMQAEMAKRISQAKRGMVDPDDHTDTLLADAEFKTKAMATWGVVPGKAKVSDEEIAKIRESIEKDKLQPLQKEVGELKGQLTSLYEGARDLQILEAARSAGVNEMWLTAPVEGQKAPIINVLAPYFGQSSDHGNGWFLKDKDGFAYAKTPTASAPFKTIAEFVPEFVGHETRSKTFLDDKRQRVQGGKAPAATPQAPGTVNKKDPLEFGRNLAEIASGKATAV